MAEVSDTAKEGSTVSETAMPKVLWLQIHALVITREVLYVRNDTSVSSIVAFPAFPGRFFLLFDHLILVLTDVCLHRGTHRKIRRVVVAGANALRL